MTCDMHFVYHKIIFYFVSDLSEGDQAGRNCVTKSNWAPFVELGKYLSHPLPSPAQLFLPNT